MMEQTPQIFFKFKKEEQNQRPILRSSGTFYFSVSEDKDTELHFMNYWKLKRSLEGLEFRLSIFEMNGDLIQQEKIEHLVDGANVISIKQRIAASNSATLKREGSFEFEIIAEDNLFVSYPAAVVRYVGPGWHTVAHTTQRIFSEKSGDHPDIIDQTFVAEEGNQTIHPDPWLEPFFIIHNGPYHMPDDEVIIKITNDIGETHEFLVSLGLWEPRQTKLFFLRDLCDFRNAANGRLATYRIKFNVRGIFPRIIAGIHDDRNNALSIDHTNFAATTGPAISDSFVCEENSKNNLVFVMPHITRRGWKSFVDVYPTFPDGDFSVSIEEDGQTRVEDLAVQSEKRLKRFEHQNSKTSSFSFESAGRVLPRRFHMGIHYQYEDGTPGFLIDGPMPSIARAVSTRWCPIFAETDQENIILIADRCIGSDEWIGVTGTVSFFNEAGDPPIKRNISVPPRGVQELAIVDDTELSEFLSGGHGWAYFRFEPASHAVVHYLSRRGKSVATCHAF